MALHTKKEFAELCGMPSRSISTYVGRKKIKLSGKFIDDKDDLNIAFLKRKGVEVLAPTDSAPTTGDKKTPPPEVPDTDGAPYSDKRGTDWDEIEKAAKNASIEKTEVETRIKLLQEQKLMGEAIPTDLVRGVISSLSKSMVSSFKDGADNFLIQISKRTKLTAAARAELTGQLIKIINEASAHAIRDSKKSMAIILKEYSNKKGVGEHG